MQFFKNKYIYLRKSNIFNKGRYSRTRQIVRGIFFFSLILNISIIYGILFLYYLYTIKLSYIWWLFLLLIGSFIIPTTLRRQTLILKYNLYKVNFNKIYLKLNFFKKIIILYYFKLK